MTDVTRRCQRNWNCRRLMSSCGAISPSAHGPKFFRASSLLARVFSGPPRAAVKTGPDRSIVPCLKSVATLERPQAVGRNTANNAYHLGSLTIPHDRESFPVPWHRK
jgi:hypothetical protein